MSDVIKIAGRLGRLRVSSPFPRIEEIVQPQRAPDNSAVAEAPPAVEPQDVQTLLADAYRRGFHDGEEKGRTAADAEAEERLAAERGAVGAYVEGLRKEFAKLAARLEQEAFRFAVAVAGRIVKHEVTVDDEVVVRQIQEGIRRVVGVESLKLRINPRDEAMVRTNKSFITAKSESVRDMVIETDEKIEPGGCILETSSGTVDARIFTQLEQIEAALFGQVVS